VAGRGICVDNALPNLVSFAKINARLKVSVEQASSGAIFISSLLFCSVVYKEISATSANASVSTSHLLSSYDHCYYLSSRKLKYLMVKSYKTS